MARIFVNFRNGDQDALAGFLADDLVRRFGRDQVFRSTESIPPGTDFVEELERQLAECDVLLAVIGVNWLTVTDVRGRRRLDDPDDWVRREIANALSAGKRVVPVLIGTASLPRSADLPEDIEPLARRQYLQIQGRTLNEQRAKLIRVLTPHLEDVASSALGLLRVEGTVTATVVEGGEVVAAQARGMTQGTLSGAVDVERVGDGAKVVGASYDAGSP